MFEMAFEFLIHEEYLGKKRCGVRGLTALWWSGGK